MKYPLLATFIFLSTLVSAQKLIDEAATVETCQLFRNLQRIAAKGMMFGHHEDMAYGVGWEGLEGQSDVKAVCGAFPAVHGWDVGKESNDLNIDNVSFSKTIGWIQAVYNAGGINTISWHVDNPLTGSNAWDTTQTVSQILPGGPLHLQWIQRLDRVANFLNRCKVGNTYIPIIFRPYHEHNGNWFWWGKGHCAEQDYIALWRFTVDYLKNTKGLHHLIYAISPDRSRMNMEAPAKSYLYGYPGDAYVDILGIDDYMDVGVSWNKKTKSEQRTDFVRALETISILAREKGKVAAVTETGLEGITDPKWFTDVILEPILSSNRISIAYLMVWRNANQKHHYAPYPGHLSADNFITFYKDPHTLFQGDVLNIYTNELR